MPSCVVWPQISEERKGGGTAGPGAFCSKFLKKVFGQFGAVFGLARPRRPRQTTRKTRALLLGGVSADSVGSGASYGRKTFYKKSVNVLPQPGRTPLLGAPETSVNYCMSYNIPYTPIPYHAIQSI